MIFIEGERVTLKTLTREEYHQFCKRYISDPIIDSNPYIYDKDKVDRSYDANKEKESWYRRVGILLSSGEVIGELSFKRINYEKSQCELGIILVNDEYKGLGYGAEAIKLAIDYAFKELKLKNILADTMSSNIRMQKILNKYGFELINKEEKFYDMGGRIEDRLNYRLINKNPSLT